MSVLANVVFTIGSLLGFRMVGRLLTGRYVRPRRELRAFLLIDMKNSTGVAERLGAVRFHELLNDFFRDIAEAALECGAEIHKYVGDEAILTWPADARHARRRRARLSLRRCATSSPPAARSIAGGSAWCPSSAPPCIAARSSPARSAMSAPRSPMSATR